MATQDLSRHLLQPAKHYASARMQQGRALLDSDFNEAEMLDDEGQRVLMVDVVGQHGSSTAGFKIGAVNTTGSYDFEILQGSYFLGGMRHVIEDIAGSKQKFRKQRDWLQSSGTDLSTLPALPASPRHDLVYLVGWEQTVSAAEDLELVEHALGGRDTSVRTRWMQRVYVLPGTGADCATVFNSLIATLYGPAHTLDPASNELKSAARLKVGFTAPLPSDDLCNSTGGSGYAGSENQAIRVQTIKSDRFLWAYDNASPLHRVLVTRDGTTLTIDFLNPPQEQSLFPLKGQIVELLPWGAELPNGEHIADHPVAPDIGGGLYCRVATTYNHVTKSLTATIAATETATVDALLAWLASYATPALPEEQQLLFLRVWNPDGNESGECGTTFAGDPVPLPGTGLNLTFSGTMLIGDYWILAARPRTPTVLVPWDLTTPVPPHGPRRFFCPLGMLHWTFPLGVRTVTVGSCRRPFRPLTRLRGCCNVTVGDGAISFGDYATIQDAIEALPRGEPGKICILPGEYTERFTLQDRSDIVIEGCGPRTVLRTPPGNTSSDALITLVKSAGITLRDFKLDATGHFGIRMKSGGPAETTWCSRITLERLDVTTRRDPALPVPTTADLAITATRAAFPLSTVDGDGCFDIKLMECSLTEIGDLSAAPNVRFYRTRGLTVRNCKILSPPGDGSVSNAWGGLYLAGDSSDILVERCLIEGGLGHGITLGSAHIVGGTDNQPPSGGGGGGGGGGIGPGDCPTVILSNPVLPAGDTDAPPPVWVPDDGPRDVRIRRNRIRGMGSSGISVFAFWPESAVDEQVLTDNLVIADNTIENNCTHPPEDPLPDDIRAVAAFGGIVLADASGLRIHDNLIRGNGPDHLHPVCGIYVGRGENITIENNQITDNGRRAPGNGHDGHRAGIALQYVGRHDGQEDLSQPAARIRGNIVHQPAGRALQLYGLGPFFIEANVFVSEGLDKPAGGPPVMSAHCIEVLNIGISPELIAHGFVPADLEIFPSPPFGAVDYSLSPALFDGRIHFTDNTVRFNPAPDTITDIKCINRFRSHGDVAILNNQFLVKLQPNEGFILADTMVTAWSTRTSHNRWEDPAYAYERGGPFATDTSAYTLAFRNITTLNQATRCIHAKASGDPESDGVIALNQVLNAAGCGPFVPGFA